MNKKNIHIIDIEIVGFFIEVVVKRELHTIYARCVPIEILNAFFKNSNSNLEFKILF